MSCTVRLEGDTLIAGNEVIERRWRVVGDTLLASSIRAGNHEWLRAPSLPATACAARLSGDVLVAGTRTYRVQVLAGCPAIVLAGQAASSPGESVAAEATGIEQPASDNQLLAADRLELLELPSPHLRLTQVRLLDQTDIHNELVFENEWLLHPNEALLELAGNLFILEDALTGNGLIWVKLGPLPHARPVKSAVDLRVTGTGMCRPDGVYRLGLYGTRYPVALLAYGRGERTAVLQEFQRSYRHPAPRFLSNTWGDRSRDARINETFLRAEIEAGARLGVDVVQIDDGWQRGRTANSATAGGVWTGFWAADANFWEPHPERFPNGLRPVIELARERGMGFGLWFAPDSANDFANWERDAATVLKLHRELGVDYFKIDGVKARTAPGEENLQRFFERVLVGSASKVVFDLDVTAEVRPGYWGALPVGPLFVENRYTDYHRYWPHHTLRNLWKLAHYVDPARLRIEFLNHARQTAVYGNDPLAPARYPPAYLFATTMFANPLGWFEVSNLPVTYFEQVAPLVKIWKQHRDAIFSQPILPIGEPPDGTSWTGFHAQAGYALVFRELNDRPQWQLPFQARQLLAGNGMIRSDGSIEIPEPPGFVFLKTE